MGIDQRGVMRGRCRVPECDCADFLMLDNSSSCGYCGDPPAKHMPQEPAQEAVQSASPQTHTGPALLQAKKWMDVKYGWIPNAKRPTGKFYNSVLKSFFPSYWPYCGQESFFRQAFILERKRRWEWEKKLNSIEQEVANLKSDNPAFAGRYLNEHTNIKPNKFDTENLERLLDLLINLKMKVDGALSDVKVEDDNLFLKNGKIKSGRVDNHQYNEQLMERMRILSAEINSLVDKLSKKKEIIKSVWSHKPVSADANERRRKRLRRQNNWKVKDRSRKQCLQRMVHIFISLGGEPMEKEMSSSHWGIYQLTDINEGMLREVFGTKPSAKDKRCLELLMEEGCFRMQAQASVSNFIS